MQVCHKMKLKQILGIYKTEQKNFVEMEPVKGHHDPVLVNAEHLEEISLNLAQLLHQIRE